MLRDRARGFVNKQFGLRADSVSGVQAMVRDHAGDSRWGAHAHAIAHGNMWKPPGNGGHDDKVCFTIRFLLGVIRSKLSISYYMIDFLVLYSYTQIFS